MMFLEYAPSIWRFCLNEIDFDYCKPKNHNRGAVVLHLLKISFKTPPWWGFIFLYPQPTGPPCNTTVRQVVTLHYTNRAWHIGKPIATKKRPEGRKGGKLEKGIYRRSRS